MRSVLLAAAVSRPICMKCVAEYIYEKRKPNCYHTLQFLEFLDIMQYFVKCLIFNSFLTQAYLRNKKRQIVVHFVTVDSFLLLFYPRLYQIKHFKVVRKKLVVLIRIRSSN